MSALLLEENVHEATPVYLLPSEIIATIFMLLQPKYRLRLRCKVPFEVSISHVCTRWRDIALGTPFLWNNIYIYSPDSFQCVSSYLERSKNCPINIRFDIWDADRLGGDIGVGKEISPLVDLVIQHVARWQTLVVFSYYIDTTTVILSKMRDFAAPVLQRVRIVDDGLETIIDDDPVLEDCRPSDPQLLTFGTPNLTSVRTVNLQYLPPLTSVTTLHLRTTSKFSTMDINNRVLSDLTVACPSLSTLSLHGNFCGAWTVDGITIPSLRSLWFSSGDTLAAKFLTTVSLPNLQSLWLDGPHYQVIQEITHSNHQPTFPALKYLTLQAFDFYASSLFARAFPTIRALHLSYCASFHISFLEEALNEQERTRWRNLDTLVFRTTRETHSKKFSKVLNDIVSARHNRGGDYVPIQNVLVDDDILASLTSASSLRERTNLDVLRSDNFDDPWWIMSNTDSGDRL